METLFIARDVKMTQRDKTLQLRAGKKKQSIPIEKVRHLVVLHEGTLTTKLLTLCGHHGVRVSIFDYYGYFKGTFEPIDRNPAGRIKLLQAAHILDNEKRMVLAREFVASAIFNMRGNLAYYLYRGCQSLKPTIEQLEVLYSEVAQCQTVEQLMGFEGQAHQFYYQSWGAIDPRLDFGKRVRRPPNNPINCLISFLNQLVYSVVKHELFKTHLDDSLSFLHAVSSGRASLSLDVAEPFKPVLSHSLIFRLVRRNEYTNEWFEQKEGVCLLTELGRTEVSKRFSDRLEEVLLGRSFRAWVYKEGLAIERHLLGMDTYKAFRRKR